MDIRLILLIILLVVLYGGGSWGRGQPWWTTQYTYGLGGFGVVLIVLLVVLLLR